MPASCSCPARGGTVQEVFQDACENYYADESSVAPMVLVGRRTGPRRCPRGRCSGRWPEGGPWNEHVHLVDDVDAAAELFGR